MMCAPPSRRQLFVAAAGFSGACARTRRQSGRLTYLLRTEPYTFDPAKAPGGGEFWILSALFEPLLQPHPQTMAPTAGLATHCKIERDGTRYTFYLRGHPAPEGIPLAGMDSLPAEFSRERAAAPYRVPARWSDGVPITGDDIVYSWRRYVAPETGNPNAYYFYCVAGAEEVNSGKSSPEKLGVRAPASLAFQVDLRAPAPDFLQLCCTEMTLPMPRHAIEEARQRGREASWTEPGRMVTSGPFVLKEFRPRERTIVAKNPNYFDARLVGIEEIEFSAADGVVVLNLFRAGLADSMEGRVLPLQLVPPMRNMPALHMRPACACHNWRISAKRAPLDNVLLRYALNMATDKDATVRFLGMGFALLDSRLLAEILQHQWRENLGLESQLMPHEPVVHVQTNLTEGDFSGVAEESYFANYPDPYDPLGQYTANYANWSDPEFDRSLATATSIADPALRMEKLAECETMLLSAMPFVPVYFDTWVYLERPEVRGLSLNPLGVPAFKYGWIDTNPRPS